MNRIALSIVGGLMGLVAGLLAVQPVAAFFGPTTITWNASSCPPGIYSITSVARDEYGFVAQSVTTKNVSLPKGSVTQQFMNLAARTWRVSATANATDGRNFSSETQTIYGDGDAATSSRFGRARPPEIPATGLAKRRTPAPAPPPTERRSVPPLAAAPPVAAAQPVVSGSVVSAAARRVPLLPEDARGATLEGAIRRALIQLGVSADPAAGGAAWRQLIAEDIDGDGVTDLVSIEWNDGAVSVIRLGLSGPPGLR